MFYKLKKHAIRLLTVLILFYVLWLVLNRVSPVINPHEVRKEAVKRDYRGAIEVDVIQDQSH